MDEDDTQHLADLMAHVVLTLAAVMAAAVLMVAAVVLATGCAVAIHVDAAPEPGKRAVMDALADGFITLDGDSKDAQIPISTE